MFNFHNVACYNHSRVFYVCCALFMYVTVILTVKLKSTILMPKNSMCPVLLQKKKYLTNYFESKNYLEVPEWQDDSWSGKNCLQQIYIYKKKTFIFISRPYALSLFCLLFSRVELSKGNPIPGMQWLEVNRSAKLLDFASLLQPFPE